jgi:proline dehydrogenase|tara:strand:- start:8747 stop:9916 length:1170 start_codon:yes stop_codon:yes gene_type:complete
MSFKSTKTAFSIKNNFELKRAYLLFKLISYPFLVGLGKFLIMISVKLRLPVDGLIRLFVFDHFCAGIDEKDSIKIVNLLATKNVKSYLHYSVEGANSEKDYDDCLNSTIKTLEASIINLSLPFSVFKPTGYGSTILFEKKSSNVSFTKGELEEWKRIIERFRVTFSRAKSIGISVFVDAEESWIQPAIDELVEDMMLEFNKERPIVFNTVQMYRNDRFEYLKSLNEKSLKHGFKVGVKLVRGAYMEIERTRALKNNYPSPICDTKEETDIQYDKGIDFMFKNIDRFCMLLGSHNEKSANKAIDLATKNFLPKDHQNLSFGQLYGMSDNITFSLAESGYRVLKYLPYGPVKEVVPYLIRRANENSSVSGQSNRELDMISKELKRRKELKT